MSPRKSTLGAAKKRVAVVIFAFSVCAVLAAGLYITAGKRSGPIPPAIPETVRGLRAAARLDVPGLMDFIDANLPETRKKEPFMAAMDLLKGMDLEQVHLFLFGDEQRVLLPVAVFDGEEAADPGRWLDTAGSAHVARQEDGTYAFRTTALPEDGRNMLPLADYRIWVFPGSAVVGPLGLSDRWANGVEALMASALFDVASGVEFPGAVVSVAARIVEPRAGWEQRILNQPAVRKAPLAGMIVAAGIGLLSELMEPLQKIDALALAAGPAGDAVRKITYVHHFRNPDAGCGVIQEAEDGPLGYARGVIDHFLTLLRGTDVMKKESRCKEGRFFLDLSWNAADDAAAGELFAEAAAGYVFNRMAAGGLDPTPGSVATTHTLAPKLKKRLAVGPLQERLKKRIEKSVFPTIFGPIGETPRMDLALDPVQFPNAALSTLEYRVLSATSPDGSDVLGEAVDEYRRIFARTFLIPIQPGTPAEKLDKAEIAIRLTIPTELELFDFDKNDPILSEKSAGGLTAALTRLEKDIAGVSVSGGEQVRLFAFDEDGNALSGGEAFSSNLSQTARFHGLIHTVRAAVVKKSERLDFKITADLNQGKEIGLPPEPDETVPVRHTRMNWKAYPNLSQGEVADLTIRWVEGEEGSWINGLSIDLPRGPAVGKAEWAVNFFGKDRPRLIEGHPVGQPKSLCLNVDADALKTAHAAFGTADLAIRAGIVRLDFTKTRDGAPVTRRLADGTEAVAVFEKNWVTLDAPDAKLMQHVAFAANGRPLRLGRKDQGYDPPRFFYFGVPVAFRAALSTETLRRTIPFDIVKRPVNETAYAAYRSAARAFPEVKRTLEQLRDARHASRQSRRSDIAQLHYAHGSDHRPLRLISKKIAHSDPAGATLFGYAPAPYLGYYFTLPEGTVADGRCAPYPEAEPVTLEWEKGTVQVPRFRQDPRALMAIPEKEGMPAFCLMMGKMYMRMWNKTSKQCVPPRPFGDGWEGWVSTGDP